jgi:hypothetical protein
MHIVNVLLQAPADKCLICFASLCHANRKWVSNLIHIIIMHEQRPSNSMIILEKENILRQSVQLSEADGGVVTAYELDKLSI